MEESRTILGTKEPIGPVPPLDLGVVAFDEAEGPACRTICLHKVRLSEFEEYVAAVLRLGYAIREEYTLGTSRFYAFEKEDTALFLNYYPEIGHMTLVGEKDSGYYRLQDNPGCDCVGSLLTHIDLEDYGMSYMIRMSDGRFLILDGGWDLEPDADKLMKQLKKQSPDSKPVIAAWIFTHPHIDHYRCFLVFYEKYREDVVIQSFLYNFPEITEELVSAVPLLLEEEETEALGKLEQFVSGSGVPTVRPHTGQVYRFSNVRMEVLASPDDACYAPCNVNSISLVLRMEIEGQRILFCGDSELDMVYLAERYGTYLKSDLLQVTHHGFNGGSIPVYRLVWPAVCLVPVSEKLFFGTFGYQRAENQALIYDLDVKEIITGATGDRVLELPYRPKPNGQTLLFDTARQWQEKLGARTWVFGDMTWETCQFSVLNMTYGEGTIRADLFFEDPAYNIRAIEIKAPAKTVKRVDFTEDGSIDPDALYFNHSSLAKKGIPAGKTFAVHFTSDRPLVIWGSKEPVYMK